jgi:predicted DNA repair protein MutK
LQPERKETPLSTGLLALLDDVTALVKLTATTLDDVPAQVAKSTGKVSGIVIDDAAVTPKYVVGLHPKRELGIIWNITKNSLYNKLVILVPLALILGWFAPWAIPPLLMIGGGYLCFEGYEKVHTIFAGHGPEAAYDEATEEISPEELERMRTAGAIRTDFILSAEIVAITYSTVSHLPVATQIAVLFVVGFSITVAVYGFVALVVKADDFGLWLAKTGRTSLGRALGRYIVKAMPGFLKLLSWVGTAAMLWVGAGIIAHGIPPTNDLLYSVKGAFADNPAVGIASEIFVLLIAGLVLGLIIAVVVGVVFKVFPGLKTVGSEKRH